MGDVTQHTEMNLGNEWYGVVHIHIGFNKKTTLEKILPE